MPSARDAGRLAALAALGLGEDASAHEILSAYRRLARASHPDTARGDPSETDFARVHAAYRYLTTRGGQPAGEPSTHDKLAAPGSDPASAAARSDEQYRWPDEPQVVAGPVIIRPLPQEPR